MKDLTSFMLLAQNSQFHVKTHSKIHCYITCTHLLVSPCCFLKLLKPLVERSTVHPLLLQYIQGKRPLSLTFGFHVDWTCCPWKTTIGGSIHLPLKTLPSLLYFRDHLQALPIKQRKLWRLFVNKFIFVLSHKQTIF